MMNEIFYTHCMSQFRPKFSSDILGLYLDFIKFAVEKADPHVQVVPSILKVFPITISSIYSKIKMN